MISASALSPETVAALVDPITHAPLVPLTLPSGVLVLRSPTGDIWPLSGGILEALPASQVAGDNLLFQGFYDHVARWFGWLESFGERIAGVGADRLECLAELVIASGARVLEVSVGSGANLAGLPSQATYVGIDISRRMLERARRSARRSARQVDLVHAAAEALPFRDHAFDVVFHVGGINFFSDRRAALAEMVRVARPGTRVVVIDETESGVDQYRRMPWVRRYFRERPPVAPPIAELPGGVTDVTVKTLCSETMYCLAFTTPVA